MMTKDVVAAEEMAKADGEFGQSIAGRLKLFKQTKGERMTFFAGERADRSEKVVVVVVDGIGAAHVHLNADGLRVKMRQRVDDLRDILLDELRARLLERSQLIAHSHQQGFDLLLGVGISEENLRVIDDLFAIRTKIGGFFNRWQSFGYLTDRHHRNNIDGLVQDRDHRQGRHFGGGVCLVTRVLHLPNLLLAILDGVATLSGFHVLTPMSRPAGAKGRRSAEKSLARDGGQRKKGDE
jgi:hypothetical protein